MAKGLLLGASGSANMACVRQAITNGFADSRILQGYGQPQWRDLTR